MLDNANHLKTSQANYHVGSTEEKAQMKKLPKQLAWQSITKNQCLHVVDFWVKSNIQVNLMTLIFSFYFIHSFLHTLTLIYCSVY